MFLILVCLYNQIIQTTAKLFKDTRLNSHLLHIRVVIQTAVTRHLFNIAGKFALSSYKMFFLALSYIKNLHSLKCRQFLSQISLLKCQFLKSTFYYYKTQNYLTRIVRLLPRNCSLSIACMTSSKLLAKQQYLRQRMLQRSTLECHFCHVISEDFIGFTVVSHLLSQTSQYFLLTNKLH